MDLADDVVELLQAVIVIVILLYVLLAVVDALFIDLPFI